jgi:hypothetical protein
MWLVNIDILKEAREWLCAATGKEKKEKKNISTNMKEIL